MSFILTKNRARIFETSPEAYDYLLDKSLLDNFPQIRELAQLKINKVVPGTLELHQNFGIEICNIKQGIYKWNVEEDEYMLYPGSSSFTCPWQKHGSIDGFLDLGHLNWIIITPDKFSKNESLKLGDWSSLSEKDQEEINGIFLNPKNQQAFIDNNIEAIFQSLYSEITKQDLGYISRVNSLIDELIILTARAIQRSNEKQDSSGTQSKSQLDQITALLRNKLHYNWTVKELASVVNMKLTRFNDYIKSETGLPPHQFLINFRIKSAKNLLLNSDKSITDIAYECGFYSSQHFAYVFKSRTGVIPKEYRNRKG